MPSSTTPSEPTPIERETAEVRTVASTSIPAEMEGAVYSAGATDEVEDAAPPYAIAVRIDPLPDPYFVNGPEVSDSASGDVLADQGVSAGSSVDALVDAHQRSDD